LQAVQGHLSIGKNKEKILKGLSLGADLYVVKPFSLN
jgi:DNA-binding response OmpR family regulator